MRHNSVGGSEYYRSSASDSGLPSRPGSFTSNGSLTKSSSSSGSLHISNATRNYVDNQDLTVVDGQTSGTINIPKDPTTLPPRFNILLILIQHIIFFTKMKYINILSYINQLILNYFLNVCIV